jgi:hypothetical protein
MVHQLACSHMTERDIDRVLRIEQCVFPHPWSRNFFKLILSDMNNYAMILRNGGEIIGYGGYHLLKNGVQFLTPCGDKRSIIHLINIAIAPRAQHRGFGTPSCAARASKVLNTAIWRCDPPIRRPSPFTGNAASRSSGSWKTTIPRKRRTHW